MNETMISDERLELIFTLSCHPALAHEAKVALTIWRALGGLTTDEIAEAFLVAPEMDTEAPPLPRQDQDHRRRASP